MIKQPVSEELIKNFTEVINQYNEGAVLASEVIYKIINLWDEKVAEVFIEHKEMLALLNEKSN